MSRPWTFLSNYGHVVICLARDPESRMRDVAEAVGITERAVQQIIRELVAEGYLRKDKLGRRNRYQIVLDKHLRHELEGDVTLGAFVALVLGSAAVPPVGTSAGRTRGQPTRERDGQPPLT